MIISLFLLCCSQHTGVAKGSGWLKTAQSWTIVASPDMSEPSDWPLPPEGIRYRLPPQVVESLRHHPLSSGLFPTVIGYYPRAAGHRMRRPHHDDCLLMYCTGGKGHLWMAGQEGRVNVEAGDVVLLPPGVHHAYEADAGNPWTLYWVHFQGRDLGHMLVLLGREAGVQGWGLHWHVGEVPAVMSAFQSLLGARMTGHQFPVALHLSQQLRALLTLLAVRGVHRPTHHGLDLEKLHTWMEAHVREPVSLDDMAAVAGLSRAHLHRCYKQLTGETPLQHFLQIRMQYAAWLLDMSDRPVQAIALELGYEDPLYFSRVFRKVMGVSPSAYRQRAHA
ncbi:MAG: AraC family transcriptional regulator [Gammaproteobacteria bacterium]|nr:MAG: AraC family transcriptional regulator [Gammaproteobacteria bacterium]